MKYLVISFCLLVTLLLTSGCIPFSVPQSPEASGRLIDADTRTPVAQAHIFFRGYPKSEATSDTSGCFRINPTFKTRWLPPLPFDFFIPPGVMVAEASGYQPLVFDQTNQPEGTIVSGRDFELRKQ